MRRRRAWPSTVIWPGGRRQRISGDKTGVSDSLNIVVVSHCSVPCVDPYSRHVPSSEVRISIISGFSLNSLTRNWGFLDPPPRSRFASADSQSLL